MREGSDRRLPRLWTLAALSVVAAVPWALAVLVDGPPSVPSRATTEPVRAVAAAPACDVDLAKPPRVVVDLAGDTIEFGPVRQRQTAVRDVTVRNAGDGPLCVTGVHAGCGCLRAELVGSKRLEPGEAAALRVTLDPGPNLEGPIAKDVHLYTNDPARPTAVVRVVADVHVGVKLVDAVAHFGALSRGQPGTALVRLRSPRSEPPWEVTAVRGAGWTYGFEAAVVASPDAAFRLVELRLTHPGWQEPGEVSDAIKAATTHPEHLEFVLHARAQIAER